MYQEEEALLLLQSSDSTLSPDHRYLYVEYLPWMGDVVSDVITYQNFQQNAHHMLAFTMLAQSSHA
jgi:hypothetical protein